MDDAELASYGRHVAFIARVVEASLGDLSLTAYRILILVAEGGERSSHIAGRLALGRPAVSHAVDILVERGLMTRRVDPDDRRVAVLELTPAGRQALADADDAVVAMLRPIADHMEAPEALSSVLADATRAWTTLSAQPNRESTST